MEYVTLSNGVKMPRLGYGVYQVSREECERCVGDALEVGYRLIDTAQSYMNEAEVGAAVAASGIPRDEIFITSKVWIDSYGYDKCMKSVEGSLKRLRTDHIDLMLLHQPFGDVYGAWRALEKLYGEGVLRAVGVSNFYPDRTVDIASFADVCPMVNQIEIHPHHAQDEAVKWNSKYGIVSEAWAPFGEGRGGMFELGELCRLGEKYSKSTAQIILRWHLQRGIVVIPKSVHRERMIENFDVFDFALSVEDMDIISSLDTRKSSFFSHSDPSTVELFAKIAGERKN